MSFALTACLLRIYERKIQGRFERIYKVLHEHWVGPNLKENILERAYDDSNIDFQQMKKKLLEAITHEETME